MRRRHQAGQECSSAGGEEGSAGESGQAESIGQGQLYEVQEGETPGLALGSQQTHAELQAGGRGAGKMFSGKGPAGAGQ